MRQIAGVKHADQESVLAKVGDVYGARGEYVYGACGECVYEEPVLVKRVFGELLAKRVFGERVFGERVFPLPQKCSSMSTSSSGWSGRELGSM
jgi:hypothetical protein